MILIDVIRSIMDTRYWRLMSSMWIDDEDQRAHTCDDKTFGMLMVRNVDRCESTYHQINAR